MSSILQTALNARSLPLVPKICQLRPALHEQHIDQACHRHGNPNQRERKEDSLSGHQPIPPTEAASLLGLESGRLLLLWSYPLQLVLDLALRIEDCGRHRMGNARPGALGVKLHGPFPTGGVGSLDDAELNAFMFHGGPTNSCGFGGARHVAYAS
jgi:hypothetical protein